MKLVFKGIRSVPEVGASNRSDENTFYGLDLFRD
jgi:hypothetical protein